MTGERMEYQAALDYILSFADYERLSRSAFVFDLERIEELLVRLGNPQQAARSVHVAGTKGKGSTAAMLASILTQAGYHTGLYTSPHLLSPMERIQVDGRPMAEGDFGRLVAMIKPEVEAVNAIGGLGELTTFELLTALAFLYFREIEVDYQVLEVGLGGRLDATNVIRPEVCVITSISYDHTDVLGDTLAQIAGEKAGIIKSGSVVVCAPQLPETMVVIENTCRERGARLIKAGSEVTWEQQAIGSEGQSFRLRGLAEEYNLEIPLLGEYQLENAAAAVMAAEVLATKEASISPESIARGLNQVRWLGRLQVLRRRPWVIVDGAHNADSARRLVQALGEYFDLQRVFLIFGASSDKNIAGMVAELVSLPGEVIVTRSRHPRAVAPAVLGGEFSKYRIVPEEAGNVAAAVERALAWASPADLICATGSLFLVAEVMEYLALRG
ncbi:MAG: bifunctional folylpolyglutamate synthase/dihydrofolate synthase [Dehalococcoidales bacterium]|mgnify:CR=1 FL=1|nr:bifunctional folylpolyglutamate synthase/dihydrofolate synthase [Dehalococcoidales bacterium]MDP6577148.1 folylpolyglutamate synthase/dihydrofolate synthase family protein [Dehalococcoidales bacterium]MDP6825387.1 folylpolyglutamate synthase/dihydrofolate synthase family protein [Dehalococcoidales bacterium]